MKNNTRFKSLNVVNNDPRVSEAFQDDDGIWIWLHPGFTSDPYGAHDVHEYTVGVALEKYRRIEPCACDQCVATLAKAAK